MDWLITQTELGLKPKVYLLLLLQDVRQIEINCNVPVETIESLDNAKLKEALGTLNFNPIEISDQIACRCNGFPMHVNCGECGRRMTSSKKRDIEDSMMRQLLGLILLVKSLMTDDSPEQSIYQNPDSFLMRNGRPISECGHDDLYSELIRMRITPISTANDQMECLQIHWPAGATILHQYVKCKTCGNDMCTFDRIQNEQTVWTQQYVYHCLAKQLIENKESDSE